LHDQLVNGKFNGRGTVFCYLSNDGGRTWRRSKSQHDGTQADGKRLVLQEPGVVELKDGRVMMFIRASGGAQQVSYSSDGGETWTVPVRSSLESPLSPASIKRLAGGELLAVWNNHAGMDAKDPLYNRRCRAMRGRRGRR
jgi:Neuraminidase (sialidase)